MSSSNPNDPSDVTNQTNSNKSSGIASPNPLISSADILPDNYARARFDDDLAWYIRQIGSQRAPNSHTKWRHIAGFAGELATAAYLGVSVNQEITDDYVGDEGFDLRTSRGTVEVKTMMKEQEPQLKVPEDQEQTADYYVLARTSNPSELVELIGWTSRETLIERGEKSPEDELVYLNHEHLHIFEPIFLTPDKIRKSQQVP